MLNICDVTQLDTEIYTKPKQSIFLSKISFYISLLSSIHLPFIFYVFFFFFFFVWSVFICVFFFFLPLSLQTFDVEIS